MLAPTLMIDILIERGALRRHVRLHSEAKVVALTGPSGAGKTSVLNAIAGLLRPSQGRIEVEGRVLFDSGKGVDVPVWQRDVGYVFQDARLFPQMSVRANLRYAHRRGNNGSSFTFDDIVQLLGIAALLKRRPHNLSGGEAQRVAIGRALLSQPRILLLDEPLASLDRARRDELIPYFQRIRDQLPLPMIYVSHSLDEVRQLTATVYDFD